MTVLSNTPISSILPDLAMGYYPGGTGIACACHTIPSIMEAEFFLPQALSLERFCGDVAGPHDMNEFSFELFAVRVRRLPWRDSTVGVPC
jgi:hypothetical protein